MGVSFFVLEALTACLFAFLVGHGTSALSNTPSSRRIRYIYRQISRKGVHTLPFLSISCKTQGKPMVFCWYTARKWASSYRSALRWEKKFSACGGGHRHIFMHPFGAPTAYFLGSLVSFVVKIQQCGGKHTVITPKQTESILMAVGERSHSDGHQCKADHETRCQPRLGYHYL